MPPRFAQLRASPCPLCAQAALQVLCSTTGGWGEASLSGPGWCEVCVAGSGHRAGLPGIGALEGGGWEPSPHGAAAASGPRCGGGLHKSWARGPETVSAIHLPLPDLLPAPPHLACLPGSGSGEPRAPRSCSSSGRQPARRTPRSPPGQQLNRPEAAAAQSGPGHQGPFRARDGSLGSEPPVVPLVHAGAWMRPGIQRDWPRWGRRTALEG